MRYRLMNYAPAIDRWAEIRFNMLTISDLKDQIPDYSKDIKLNLSSLIINSFSSPPYAGMRPFASLLDSFFDVIIY